MTLDLREIEDQLGKHAARVKAIGEEITEAVNSKAADAESRAKELRTEQERITAAVEPLLKDKELAEMKATLDTNQDALTKLMSSARAQSKADLIGGGIPNPAGTPSGDFLGSITDMHLGFRDPDTYARAKATLEGMGTLREEAWGKATLGTTDALGGWVIPNAQVEEFIKPAQFQNFYRDICTVVSGVTGATIDLPFRSGSPSRAVIAPFGETKQNQNLGYNGYTATMYTLAKIHDIGVQFARQSRGAAERDVLQELATAFALGERYYIVNGSGSSEPYGLQTAITNAPATFVTTHTPAATLAGSIAAGIAKAAGALADRDREPNAAVVKASVRWAMLAEGTDEAGFFLNPSGGPTAIRGVPSGTLISPWGIPVYGDSQLAEADDLIVGDFKALKLYFGASYRVDTSTEAGDRWDKNLIGYRGEEEMGLDARPAVYAGAFQRVDDVTV